MPCRRSTVRWKLFAQGFASSLQPENLRARHLIDGMESHAAHPKLPLLFDPQTAGGLLAAVPAGIALGIDAVEIGIVSTRGRPTADPSDLNRNLG